MTWVLHNTAKTTCKGYPELLGNAPSIDAAAVLAQHTFNKRADVDEIRAVGLDSSVIWFRRAEDDDEGLILSDE